MDGIFGVRHVTAILLIVVAGWGWGWVWAFDRPAHAGTAGFLAGALACPAGVEGPDCTRDTALDVLVQPVAAITECPTVGMLLATHLSLPAGGTHKTFCERRKG